MQLSIQGIGLMMPLALGAETGAGAVAEEVAKAAGQGVGSGFVSLCVGHPYAVLSGVVFLSALMVICHYRVKYLLESKKVHPPMVSEELVRNILEVMANGKHVPGKKTKLLKQVAAKTALRVGPVVKGKSGGAK